MFKKIFIKLCNERGIAPTVVCQEIGLSNAAYSKWDEKSIPRQATLQKLADYFNVTVEYLKGEEKLQEDKPNGYKIPVLGTVAAGIPIEAIEDIIDYEEIPEEMAKNGKYFGLMIKGHSMEPRIVPGDIIIINKDAEISNGDIAVVLIANEEATCKKIKRTSEGILLLSLNTDFEPIFYSNKQIEQLPITIIGKVEELRAKF